MELVIKIPTAIYEASQILDAKYDDTIQIPLEVIAKGTPLPKGHGRLIDADWVKNTLDIYVINEYNGQFIRRSDIDTIPTIIEGSDAE